MNNRSTDSSVTLISISTQVLLFYLVVVVVARTPVFADPDPINRSGSGDQITSGFNLEEGLSIIEMAHSGSGHFSMVLRKSNGDYVALLVNEIGTFQGSRAQGVTAGAHYIDVSANGSWTVAIQQPRPSSAPAYRSFSGNTQEATQLFSLSGGLTVFEVTNQGSGHFSIWLLDSNGDTAELLVNETGDFDGSTAEGVAAGIYLMDVSADGSWTVDILEPRPHSAPGLTYFAGTGDTATTLFSLGTGLKTFHMNHLGSGHFSVWLLDSEGDWIDLLANETGPYSGSEDVEISQSGIYVLDVNADGAWNITIEPSAEGGADLVFPHSLNVGSPFPPNRYIGIAVFNPNSVATDVEFIAYDNEGRELGRKLLSELAGRGAIPPLGQSAMLTGEIFEGLEIASIVAKGTSGPVQIFFMIGDYNMTSLDGVAGSLVDGEELYFPIARSNATEATVLFLFNSRSEDAVEVALELFDGSGAVVAEVSRTLMAQGSLTEEVAAIFGREEVDGYVRAAGDGVIRGFQLYSHGKGISALSAQLGKKATCLVAPHYFATDGGNTAVWLQNIGQNWADVSIKGYRDDGMLVGEHDFRLPSGERFVGSVTEFLPIEFTGSSLASGYFVVDLVGGSVGIFPDDATVIGSITFTAFEGNTIATLPLTQVGSKESRFLHVAQSDVLNMYTGVAVLNLSGSPANVSVKVYDQTGSMVGQKTLDPIGQGTRIVDIMSGTTFFQPGFEQIGGHIEIISDQSVFIFALFGDYSGNFLSAIESQSP